MKDSCRMSLETREEKLKDTKKANIKWTGSWRN